MSISIFRYHYLNKDFTRNFSDLPLLFPTRIVFLVLGVENARTVKWRYCSVKSILYLKTNVECHDYRSFWPGNKNWWGRTILFGHLRPWLSRSRRWFGRNDRRLWNSSSVLQCRRNSLRCRRRRWWRRTEKQRGIDTFRILIWTRRRNINSLLIMRRGLETLKLFSVPIGMKLKRQARIEPCQMTIMLVSPSCTSS